MTAEPFHGYVETTGQALRLIYAARQGVIPRITRRLTDNERRKMIKSGAVFVFSVEESGIKRWTDGLLWSPSRIVGNFLVYREINERANSRGGHRRNYPSDDGTSDSSRNSPEASYRAGEQGSFKVNGLTKKTITVTTDGASDLHLISYYTVEDVESGRLKKPTSRPDIMSMPMDPNIFRMTNFRVPLKIEIGPDRKPRIANEPEDEDVSCKTEDPFDSVDAMWSRSRPEPSAGAYPGTGLYLVPAHVSSSSKWSNGSQQSPTWSSSTSSPNRYRQITTGNMTSSGQVPRNESWSPTFPSPTPRWNQLANSGHLESVAASRISRPRSTRPYPGAYDNSNVGAMAAPSQQQYSSRPSTSHRTHTGTSGYTTLDDRTTNISHRLPSSYGGWSTGNANSFEYSSPHGSYMSHGFDGYMNSS